MLVEKIEEYLDGGLDAAGRREVEAAVACDPKAARLMAACTSRRALRAATYETYMPTKHEAGALASQVMAAAYAPVGRIGYWVRRGAAVAAAVVVVAGTFVAGRLTASPQSQYVDRVETRTVYEVAYKDINGDQSVSEFASAEERDAFVKKLDQQGGTVIQVAEIPLPWQL